MSANTTFKPASDRYQRLRQLKWWDETTVRNAVAVVAGAGALGNEVVKNLGLLGWGKVRLVDFDTVELSNLTRSMFFRPEDIGRPKNAVVAAAARRLNPDLEIECLTGDLRVALSAGMVKRSHVVFGCLDNIAARLALNGLAGAAGVLMVDGGLTPWEGTVSIFQPPDSACYGCGLTKEDLDELRLRHSCPVYAARARAHAGVPTTPAVAAITAGLMVQQGLKYVHGLKDPRQLAIGHQLRIDTCYDRFWKAKLWTNPACSFHPTPSQVESVAGVTGDTPWRTILAAVRNRLCDPQAVLHLPHAVLEHLTCRACGDESWPELAVVGTDVQACRTCGRPATPTLFNQVTGSERWIDRTPDETGFPPFTWISAVGETELLTVELSRGERAPC